MSIGMFLNILTALLYLSVFLVCSSLPRAPQDLWWRMAGPTAKEDVGHEGQPHPGLLSQVGLWEGPVEVKRLWLRRHRVRTCHLRACICSTLWSCCWSQPQFECCIITVKTTRKMELILCQHLWGHFTLCHLSSQSVASSPTTAAFYHGDNCVRPVVAIL